MQRTIVINGKTYHKLSIPDKTYETLIQKEKLRVYKNVQNALATTKLFDSLENPENDRDPSLERQIREIQKDNESVKRLDLKVLERGV